MSFFHEIIHGSFYHIHSLTVTLPPGWSLQTLTLASGTVTWTWRGVVSLQSCTPGLYCERCQLTLEVPLDLQRLEEVLSNQYGSLNRGLLQSFENEGENTWRWNPITLSRLLKVDAGCHEVHDQTCELGFTVVSLFTLVVCTPINSFISSVFYVGEGEIDRLPRLAQPWVTYPSQATGPLLPLGRWSPALSVHLVEAW